MTWKHNDDKLRRHFTIWYIFNLEIAERCWLDSSNADWLWLTGGYVAILATYFLVYNVSDTLTYWRLLGTDPVSSLGAEETLILMAQSWHQPPRHEAPGHTIIVPACCRAGEAIAGLFWQPQVATNPEFSWLLPAHLPPHTQTLDHFPSS